SWPFSSASTRPCRHAKPVPTSHQNALGSDVYGQEQALRRWTIVVAALAAAITVLFVRVVVVARDFSTVVTAARFDALRSDHTALRAFLRRMPKGADLHMHLSGAVYAEHVSEWAMLDSLCVRTTDLAIVMPPCGEGTVPAANAQKDQAFYDRLVNALSMRFFRPSEATPSSHDHFFSAFERITIAP